MSAGRAKEKEGSFATNPALREVRAAPDFSIQLSRELEPRIDALVATVQTPRPTKKWIAGAAGAGGAGTPASTGQSTMPWRPARLSAHETVFQDETAARPGLGPAHDDDREDHHQSQPHCKALITSPGPGEGAMPSPGRAAPPRREGSQSLIGPLKQRCSYKRNPARKDSRDCG